MLRDARRQRDKEWGTRGSMAQAGYRTMDKLVLGVLGEASPVFVIFSSGAYKYQNDAQSHSHSSTEAFRDVWRRSVDLTFHAVYGRVDHTQLSSVDFSFPPCKHACELMTMNSSSVACVREP